MVRTKRNHFLVGGRQARREGDERPRRGDRLRRECLDLQRHENIAVIGERGAVAALVQSGTLAQWHERADDRHGVRIADRQPL